MRGHGVHDLDKGFDGLAVRPVIGIILGFEGRDRVGQFADFSDGFVELEFIDVVCHT